MQVVHATAVDQIKLVCQSVPTTYLNRLLRFLAESIQASLRLEFQMIWVRHLLNSHSNHLDTNTDSYLSALRALFQSISQHHDDLTKLCDSTTFSLAFITSVTLSPEEKEQAGVDTATKATKSKRQKSIEE